ncbi:MAG: hypothetical protein M1817_004626 [Caeruleum heppii]|nr:MAG: hypothetical protein M1817_004626 [Caeruleum heppii]
MAFSGLGIGDLLGVTRLAWNLYHNCYLVAREAPDEFRQLVNELASLQGVLRTLRDDVNSDKAFLERMGENRRQTLSRCLAGCFDTLRRLEALVNKYRELGIGDGIMFWQRIKWITQQRDVSSLRAKIMVHTANISLCMTSIGKYVNITPQTAITFQKLTWQSSSLLRLETTMVNALERQQAVTEDDTTLTRQETTSTTDTEVKPLQREMTGLTIANGAHTSPRSTPSLMDDDPSESGSSNYKPENTPTQGYRKQSQSSTLFKDRPPSPRPSEDGTDLRKRSVSGYVKPPPRTSVADSIAPTSPDADPSSVAEVVAEAMKEVSRIRQREQASRPLRIALRDEAHRPDDDIIKIFDEAAKDEMKVRRLNARDWLRVATWWLLKARNSLDLFEKPMLTNAQGSCSPSSDSRSASGQAYVDLLKASWILYDIILKNINLTALLTHENQKLFYDLSEALTEDLHHFAPVDVPDRTVLLRQNLNIWEMLQPEEENKQMNNLLPGLDNGRWITVEPEDAGEEDEKVLCRTFVNAEIGSKKERIRSRGAAYMLLLTVKESESEPKITLCNQSGSCAWTRDVVPDDLVETEAPWTPEMAMSPDLGGSGTLSLRLKFDQMRVSITFQKDTDLRRFFQVPTAYFAAIQRREPRRIPNATESVVFQSSLEVYEILEASTMKAAHPRRAWRSCGVRILETVGKVGWRTTRRLVVNSSAGVQKTWCTSTFLPMSRVQISREGGSKQILMKWSDCTHEQHRTDGSWNKVYSYVYDDGNPNHALNLCFRTQMDADNFEKIVLQLGAEPVYKWSQKASQGFVYSICDTDQAQPVIYKAIMLTHVRLAWKYSELFFTYRDTDYSYNGALLTVRFPQVWYTDYISSHVDKLFKPPADSPPAFAYCQKKVGFAPISFEDESVSHAFMSSLTLDHTLVFSRRVHWISDKPPSRFMRGSVKNSKGQSEVQLWRKGTEYRLASRWDDHVDEKWMTMSIDAGRFGPQYNKDSNRAILPGMTLEKGRQIDMANIVARNPREANRRTPTPITIAFDTSRDREDFAAALEGNLSPRRETGTFSEHGLGIGDMLNSRFMH